MIFFNKWQSIRRLDAHLAKSLAPTTELSVFFKFLSSRSFVKSRQLWDLINVLSLTNLDLCSREAGKLHRRPALIYNPVSYGRLLVSKVIY